MAKVKDILGLLDEQAAEVTASPKAWSGFLDMAANLYRYPFQDILLIHAQRPGATACLDLMTWNQSMSRLVNRGAKGIALLDQRPGGRTRLKYVFDISDTHSMTGGEEPLLWQVREEDSQEIARRLTDLYQLRGDGSGNLQADLMRTATSLTLAHHGAAFRTLLADPEAGGTLKKDENTAKEFRYLMVFSIFYLLSKRCGLDPMKYMQEKNFSGIVRYRNPALLSHLGTVVCTDAAQVLRQIGSIVKKIVENKRDIVATEEEISYNSFNTKEEANKKTAKTKQNADNIMGGDADENRISSQRSVFLSGSDRAGDGTAGRGGEDREVRKTKGEVPERTRTGTLHQPSDDGKAEPSSRGDTEIRGDTSGSLSGDLREDLSGAGQKRHRGVGGIPEVHPGEDRGRDSGDPGGKVNKSEKDTKAKKAEARQKASAFLFAPVTCRPGRLPEEITDHFLRTGGNRSGSSLRILFHYMTQQPESAHADFLYKEYGSGCKGFMTGGLKYTQSFDKSGMMISPGDTVHGGHPDRVFLSWEEVSGRIQKLLEQGTYATYDMLEDARENAMKESAVLLVDLERNIDRETSGKIFSDRAVFEGVYPDCIKKVSRLLRNPETLKELTARVNDAADLYRNRPDILTWHKPPPEEVVSSLRVLSLDTVSFPVDEKFEYPSLQPFVTQDEIDAFLRNGVHAGSSSETIAYFQAHTDQKSRTAFLKEQYGNGGSAPAISGADDSRANYNAKGIRLERGDRNGKYQEARITWAKAARRVGELIEEDRFLAEEEVASLKIPEFPQGIQISLFDWMDEQEKEAQAIPDQNPGRTQKHPEDEKIESVIKKERARCR